ncbi:ABC transporter permease [Peptostreptococcus equinus]|uniref:ABC transporter permease subunit n=1 Tax=Peptostreptococcus equinus TaxID=3003601 RepID=A0ABY7JMC5_9FIRM|nr:ABC transporter permease subunit [Peptostreptococcus sp. CBA3647]WAW14515.1 ABC transporter permease subunit [Peptostreptococcus sp. CBA3647]
MSDNIKSRKFFSLPLMKQNIKSNMIVVIAITLIMCMVATVINYAMSTLQKETISDQIKNAEKSFYAHMFVLTSYNEQSQKAIENMIKSNPSMQNISQEQKDTIIRDKVKKLSYMDFVNRNNRKVYDELFDKAEKTRNKKNNKYKISSDELDKDIKILKKSSVDMNVYVKNFDYLYNLKDKKGVFSGKDLSTRDMINTNMKALGVSTQFIKNMTDMDMGTMMNQMYYTVMGLLPIFLLIIIVSNNLIADQVDKGSMAYILSTPTKRSAVVTTHMIYMIVMPALVISIVCLVRVFTSYMFFDTVNLDRIIGLHIGMYAIVEAVSGICFLGGCLFNSSKNAMAFGGGLTMWFFLCSLLGFFGSDDIVMLGIGVEKLSLFNKMTIVGFYDIKSISTLGTSNIDYGFEWKLAILFIIAILTYLIASIKFVKKDLPL